MLSTVSGSICVPTCCWDGGRDGTGRGMGVFVRDMETILCMDEVYEGGGDTTRLSMTDIERP